MSNPTIKAIFFDADGTLLDTAPSITATINHVLAQENREPVSVQQMRPVISAGGQGLMRTAFGIDDENQIKQLAQRLLDHYPQFITQQLSVFDGYYPVLEQLEQRGIIWGVISNKHESFLKTQMQYVELHHRSLTCIGGDTYKNKKPHPQPLLEACKIAGISPREAIYVGDCENDVIAAKRADMQSAIVEFGYIPEDGSHQNWGADLLLAHPNDLLQNP
ncbi:MAG: HAD-IA family hydrolase [Coxiellaceae bacterium]|nr:HAD-IA family hydrolase [Coxiellaceae bacterium]